MVSRHPRRHEVLIATLGTRPEVITLALDLLLEDHPIEHVVVIHTARRFMPIGRALLRLENEFPGKTRYAYAGIPCAYETVELHVDGEPFDDIATRDQAGAAFTTIYRQVQGRK